MAVFFLNFIFKLKPTNQTSLKQMKLMKGTCK